MKPARRKPGQKDGIQVIRRDADGQVDDVVISGDLLRLERMDHDRWWLAVYRGEKRVCFFLDREGKDINATVSEDDLDCIDDSKPPQRQEQP